MPENEIDAGIPEEDTGSDSSESERFGLVMRVDPQSEFPILNGSKITILKLHFENDVCDIQCFTNEEISVSEATLCRVDNSTIYKDENIILKVTDDSSTVHLMVPVWGFDAIFVEEVSDEK